MNNAKQKNGRNPKGIRQQGKNSWQIQIYTGTGPDGKRQRRFVTVRGTKQDAKDKQRELQLALGKGIPVPVNRRTVAEQLYEWVNGAAKARAGSRTIEGYQSIIDHHLAPALGNIQLKDLQPSMIDRYYGEAESGKRVSERTGKPLSKRTLHYHHRVLSKCLKHAVRQGVLGRNPCDLVDAPSPKGKKMKTMQPGEVGHLLDIASQSPHYPVIYTALNTGMRQAELLGLRWRDVDLEGCTISVSQVLYKRRGICDFREPKTANSRRRIDMTPKLALYLRKHKEWREALYSLLGKPLTLDDLVFATDLGKPVDPSVLSSSFHKLVKQAGLQGVRFHDCRHTCASLMLLRKVSPKVVSGMLGHASTAFTMDVYADIIDGMQKDAVALLDEVLPEGICASNNADLTRLSEN